MQKFAVHQRHQINEHFRSNIDWTVEFIIKDRRWIVAGGALIALFCMSAIFTFQCNKLLIYNVRWCPLMIAARAFMYVCGCARLRLCVHLTVHKCVECSLPQALWCTVNRFIDLCLLFFAVMNASSTIFSAHFNKTSIMNSMPCPSALTKMNMLCYFISFVALHVSIDVCVIYSEATATQFYPTHWWANLFLSIKRLSFQSWAVPHCVTKWEIKVNRI